MFYSGDNLPTVLCSTREPLSHTILSFICWASDRYCHHHYHISDGCLPGSESGQDLRVLVRVWRESRDSVSMANVGDTCPPSLFLCWSLLARTSSEQSQHGRPVCVPAVGMSVAGKLSSENLLSYTLKHQHFPKRSTQLSHQSRQQTRTQGKAYY